jgi:hypothetical protein
MAGTLLVYDEAFPRGSAPTGPIRNTPNAEELRAKTLGFGPWTPTTLFFPLTLNAAGSGMSSWPPGLSQRPSLATSPRSGHLR